MLYGWRCRATISDHLGDDNRLEIYSFFAPTVQNNFIPCGDNMKIPEALLPLIYLGAGNPTFPHRKNHFTHCFLRQGRRQGAIKDPTGAAYSLGSAPIYRSMHPSVLQVLSLQCRSQSEIRQNQAVATCPTSRTEILSSRRPLPARL